MEENKFIGFENNTIPQEKKTQEIQEKNQNSLKYNKILNQMKENLDKKNKEINNIKKNIWQNFLLNCCLNPYVNEFLFIDNPPNEIEGIINKNEFLKIFVNKNIKELEH